MYRQITNGNNEPLYVIAIVKTRDIRPFIQIATWDRCLEILHNHTKEQDDATAFNHCIRKDITPNECATAYCVCGRKRWAEEASFKHITIERAYANL